MPRRLEKLTFIPCTEHLQETYTGTDHGMRGSLRKNGITIEFVMHFWFSKQTLRKSCHSPGTKCVLSEEDLET
jgi:hypothetical protein